MTGYVSEGDIISDAIRLNEGELQERIGQPGILLAALEVIHGHGGDDESFGDMNEGGHYFRVDRWIVATDSQGFMDVTEYTSNLAAELEMQKIAHDQDDEHGSAADRMGEPW